jgi:anti-sigma factor RsiW
MDTQTRLEIEIGRYVDGEMSPDERTAMEQRLGSEPELARLADEIMTLRPRVAEAIHTTAGSIDGERIWRNVAGRISARPSSFETFLGGFRLFFQRRVAIGIAATAAVLVAAFLVVNALVTHGIGTASAATEVTIEYGDNPDVMATVEQDTNTGVVVVSVDGINMNEVN